MPKRGCVAASRGPALRRKEAYARNGSALALAGALRCQQCNGQLPQDERNWCPACWASRCKICGWWTTGMRFVARTQFSDGCFALEGWVCPECIPPSASRHDQAALCLAPLFKIWAQGRREDSGFNCWSRNSSAPPQPARVLWWLFVGDLGDVLAPGKLEALGIGAVLSLCPERHAEDLAEILLDTRGVELVSVVAWGDRNFHITEEAWPPARAALAAWRQRGRRVLVNCWRGVNRSCSVVLLWLVVCEGWTFLDAMRAVTLARGTALTNHSFRLQCWRVWRELRLARRPACAWRDIEQQYPDDDIASRDLRWWQSRKSSPT